MSQQNPRIILSAAMVAVLVCATALHAGKYNAVVDIGAPMPQFSDLPATDGTTLSSKDIRADVVVLVFLANHCPWVRGMNGDLVRLVDEFKGQSVRVIGVSVNHRQDDRLPAMKEHAARHKYNFTYVFDESQQVGRRLGAAKTPEYFVFNKGRKLVYMGAIHNSPAQMRGDGTVSYTRGEPTRFYAREAIKAALAGKPAPEAETPAHGCAVEYQK